LREREGDIVLLAKHFAAQLGNELRGQEASFSEGAIAALLSHRWPGNVRELENAIERACILSDTLLLERSDLGLASPDIQGSANQGWLDLSGTLSEASNRALRIVETRKIKAALDANEGNKMKAAEALDVSYKTLLAKIKDHDLL
jgi:DNA-binding NtrC family response regulator